MQSEATPSPPDSVLVVGTGLLGTSIGLALGDRGTRVWLSDIDPQHLRTATGLGAGHPAPADLHPALVVVAVPPDRVGEQVARALTTYPDAAVTDVGSVKHQPLAHLVEHADPAVLERYVGGHPMAGSERSGPLAASAALFDGRPWAITPNQHSTVAAVAAVEALALGCGALPVTLSPQEHDRAVARTSHVPHLAAALVAGRLLTAPREHLALSGQGLRDVTRVAAGDPSLYQQIVALNAGAVLDVLTELLGDLEELIAALGAGDRDGLTELLVRGGEGTRAIPGKHGGPPEPVRTVFVSVPDHPGELARLFADAGASGVNIEDVRIDHDPGRPVGLVELVVSEAHAVQLLDVLARHGWTTHP